MIFLIFSNSFNNLDLKNCKDDNLFNKYDNLPIEPSDSGSALLWHYNTQYFVQTLAISEDGNYIVSGSKNYGVNKLLLFNKNYSKPLWSYDNLDSEVFEVDISSNGSYIVACTGSPDWKIYLFNKDSSTPLWNYQAGDIVFTVAISADGNYIVGGSKDNRIYLFHKSSSVPLWSYYTGGNVQSVDISATGSYIVVGSADDKLYLFERTSSTPVWTYTIDYIPGNWGAVSTVAISSDGNYIVGGSEVYQGTSRIYLFRRSSSTPLWNYAAGDYILSVDISSDGNYITAGGEDNNLYLFSNYSSTPIWNYDTGSNIYSTAISGDGNFIAVGTVWNNSAIYLFNKSNSTPLWKYITTDSITSVGISLDGNIICGGGWDRNVYLFRNGGAIDDITLYTDAENPDSNGEFNLYWNSFFQTEYIWLYQSNRYITTINRSVDLINFGASLNNPYFISGLSNGTYYFRLKVNNSIYGEQYSNCIRVNIVASYYLEWYRLWGGDNVEGGKGLAVDSNNMIYQTGYIMNGPLGRNDGILIKTDSMGNQLWNRTWGTSNDDGGMDVEIDDFDNIYVVGTVDKNTLDGPKLILVKYNPQGSKIWSSTWNELGETHGWSITIDSQNNIYVAGYTKDVPNDFVIIKFNPIGQRIWVRIWGGSGDEGRYGVDIAIDSEDNIYLTGYSTSFGSGSCESILVKYNSNGDEIWSTTWGGDGADAGQAICVDSADNIYITGYTDSFGTESRILFLARYNNNGIQIWNITWSGIRSVKPYDICVDSNDTLFITGYTSNYDEQLIFMLMIDIDGEILWNTTWGQLWGEMNEGWGIVVDLCGSIYISGYTEYYMEESDEIVLLKYVKYTKLPGLFKLSSNASNPDTDGSFSLFWTSSLLATNYSILMRNNSIITLIREQINYLSYDIQLSIGGIYSFKVIAFNKFGNTSSNWVNIEVKFLSSDLGDIPIIITYTIILGILNISLLILVLIKKIRK
ncbi:MAG: SBBP repeat-containing protein [Candidatus Thorarchaeota archaeon]